MARTSIKAEAKTIKHPDGRQDVEVSVPLMQLKSQVSEAKWEEIKRQCCESKYADLKCKCDEAGAQGKADWQAFMDSMVAQKYQISAKTMEDAKNRAYRIAERYGAHLEFKES